jgi:hypothetical protein
MAKWDIPEYTYCIRKYDDQYAVVKVIPGIFAEETIIVTTGSLKFCENWLRNAKNH